MTVISASAVKELRERSGAGMMDCKKALTETQGDVEAAVDWLRKKGLAAAAKKAGRAAAEGLVGMAQFGTKGVLAEVNAETDFVGRNEMFQGYVKQVTEMVAQNNDLDTLKSKPYPGTDRTVGEELNHLIAVVGENMNFRRIASLEVSQGIVSGYLHTAIAPGMGRIGVLVALESAGDIAQLDALGVQIAMHIAAAYPQCCRIEDVDPTILSREKDVVSEQARASGRPEEVIEKMIEGRIRKFYEESVLCEQVFLLDDSKRKISQVVEDLAKSLATPVSLKGYLCFRLGEGVEKKETDFAAEVAEQLKK
jgi:elongation factor Ts